MPQTINEVPAPKRPAREFASAWLMADYGPWLQPTYYPVPPTPNGFFPFDAWIYRKSVGTGTGFEHWPYTPENLDQNNSWHLKYVLTQTRRVAITFSISCEQEAHLVKELVDIMSLRILSAPSGGNYTPTNLGWTCDWFTTQQDIAADPADQIPNIRTGAKQRTWRGYYTIQPNESILIEYDYRAVGALEGLNLSMAQLSVNTI